MDDAVQEQQQERAAWPGPRGGPANMKSGEWQHYQQRQLEFQLIHVPSVPTTCLPSLATFAMVANQGTQSYS